MSLNSTATTDTVLGLGAALPDQQPGLGRQLHHGVCRQQLLPSLVSRARPSNTTIYDGISFWLNGGATGGQTVGLEAQAGSSWGPEIQVTAPSNTWQQFTFSLSSLGVNNITILQAIEIWNSSKAQPTFYIANVKLVAAPAPATVHVNISATQILRAVDAKMLGVNQVGWDGSIQTPTTTNLLTQMGASCLRWPGGSWGDGYHWTNEEWSYGNTGARFWGSFSPDFMWAATNTGAQAFIIANYGTSDAGEAAYGVRMFNVTNHCNFKYWEIGNEVGGSWEVDSTPIRRGSRTTPGPTPCDSPIITRR